jgi:hypothetical protein
MSSTRILKLDDMPINGATLYFEAEIRAIDLQASCLSRLELVVVLPDDGITALGGGVPSKLRRAARRSAGQEVVDPVHRMDVGQPMA